MLHSAFPEYLVGAVICAHLGKEAVMRAREGKEN